MRTCVEVGQKYFVLVLCVGSILKVFKVLLTLIHCEITFNYKLTYKIVRCELGYRNLKKIFEKTVIHKVKVPCLLNKKS